MTHAHRVVPSHRKTGNCPLGRVIADTIFMFGFGHKLSKMIPPGAQGKNPTLKESLELVPELEEIRQNDPQVNKLFDIGMKLEGLYRQ